jgi:hypothetical protein
MQIDSSTDRHTAHCSVMQLQGCVKGGEISVWTAQRNLGVAGRRTGPDWTGPDRTGLDNQTLQLSQNKMDEATSGFRSFW